MICAVKILTHTFKPFVFENTTADKTGVTLKRFRVVFNAEELPHPISILIY